MTAAQMIHKRTCGCVFGLTSLCLQNEQGADVAPGSSSLTLTFIGITLWSLFLLNLPEGGVGTNGCVLPENSGDPVFWGALAGPAGSSGC